ncbi:MAG: tetratricopeptide repeat protein [Verrucomicrobiota bacterium]|nr:tetratricopeptide repeat protein [Limisphaera sp.]MDW8382691.1 tetratricopeptide repeat protein [Verrucomicrobiota bacterium]
MSQSAGHKSNKGRALLQLLGAMLLACLTAGVFSRVLTCGFVDYDDGDYVTANEQVQAGLRWEGIGWAFRTLHASNWHPLTWISHMLDVTWFGLRPAGHHLTSLVLHSANAAMVFLLLHRCTRHATAAWFAALLFAVHPLRVESVAWVSERKDVLSLFFGLLTLLAYSRSVAEGSTFKAKALRLPALATYAAALMCKPTMVSLPFVLLLLDYWPFRRLSAQGVEPAHGGVRWSGAAKKLCRAWWPLVREKAAFFALALASCVVTYRAQQSGGAVASMEALPWQARLENVPISYARYLLKTLWPVDLAVLYPHPVHWPLAWVGLSSALIMALTLCAWQRRKHWPHLWVGWAWFSGTLVPMIGLVQVGIQSMADRYTYLPAVGLSLAAAETLARAAAPWTRHGPWLWIVCGTITSSYAILCWRQIGFWQNSETLFQRTLAVTRNNELAHNNLGYYYALQGRWEEAIHQYRAALAIRPRYPDALNNLGHALAETGRPDEALPYLEEAVRLRPQHVGILNNLGNVLAALGRFEEAMNMYHTALESDRSYADTWNNIGVALGMQGRLADALPYLREAVRLRPRHGPSYSNLGNALAALGQWSQAEEAFRQALSLNPADSRAWNNLANVLLETQRLPEAQQAYDKALALNPNNPEALFNLAQLRLRQGRTAEAQNLLLRALQLRPDYPEARLQLERLSPRSSANHSSNLQP